jgi:hypothetical protein
VRLLIFFFFFFFLFSQRNKAFPPTSYGQVDDVSLANGTVFASLISNIELDAFNLLSGKQAFQVTTPDDFAVSEAGGNLVCTMAGTASSASVQCFSASSGQLVFTKLFSGTYFSTQLLQVSQDGKRVAFAVGQKVNNTYSAQIYVVDNTGALIRSFACQAGNSTQNVVAMLLAYGLTI